jgi:imidazolonepropionase-like amidohydrolase
VNAINAGVKICVGTDLLPSDPFNGTYPTIRETELLVDAGMTPLEAIKAATRNGAELCGLEKMTGSLKAGMHGDLIVVEGKPDENIADLRNLRLVAKGCRLVWAELPTLKQQRFQILPPNCKIEGGTFIKW